MGRATAGQEAEVARPPVDARPLRRASAEAPSAGRHASRPLPPRRRFRGSGRRPADQRYSVSGRGYRPNMSSKEDLQFPLGSPLPDLARAITTGAVRLAAATAAWLRLVAEFDERGGWHGVGITLLRALDRLAVRHVSDHRPRARPGGPGAARAAADRGRVRRRPAVLRQGAGADPHRGAGLRGARCWSSPRRRPPRRPSGSAAPGGAPTTTPDTPGTGGRRTGSPSSSGPTTRAT